ncbi:MAG: NADH-quinone oxidoreductase subunit NuoK [Candidatus Manganitrophaceae bacterium]|nr:MAG: NADH-quinone oxidoreductase subunit NuoK [Candidatus Manganitrophaceae bacterium]
MVPLSYFVTLSFLLFSIGVVGILIRRNILMVLMAIELILNAVNINFVAFSRFQQSLDGQIFVFFVMTIAAAEVVVGLAIVIVAFRRRATVNVDEFNLMKW